MRLPLVLTLQRTCAEAPLPLPVWGCSLACPSTQGNSQVCVVLAFQGICRSDCLDCQCKLDPTSGGQVPLSVKWGKQANYNLLALTIRSLKVIWSAITAVLNSQQIAKVHGDDSGEKGSFAARLNVVKKGCFVSFSLCQLLLRLGV